MSNLLAADKLKRTAVIYACTDGNANVLSFLLSRGSNPNATDTSGKYQTAVTDVRNVATPTPVIYQAGQKQNCLIFV